MGKAIGVFDSGVGGLTVLRAIRRRLPGESTVYLGDTARVPYGTKSPDVVLRYSRNCARLLLGHDLKLLVVACNTASAHALLHLQEELPIPVLGVIEPGVRLATRGAGKRIAVIGTEGTIASGAYQRQIAQALPDAQILALPCPLFVPLAEEGWTDGEVPLAVVRHYLGPLRGRVDSLVLGCTHYPLLKDAIGKVLGPEVLLVDSAEAVAEAAAALLGEGSAAPAAGERRHRILVTDIPQRFPLLARRFLGEAVEAVEQVDLAP